MATALAWIQDNEHALRPQHSVTLARVNVVCVVAFVCSLVANYYPSLHYTSLHRSNMQIAANLFASGPT